MDGYLKQSTASQTRWIGPFVDDTDFKTAETALTVANTDIKVSKNGGASASKNSGGGTHDVNGMYAVTWDATDTATVGELKYSVKVAGALQVFGSYVVLEEAIYDALFAASANAFTGAAGSTTLTALASGSITAAVIATDAIDADAIADNAIDAGAIASNAIAAAKIATGAITAAKFAAGAIDAAAIADGAIDAATFAASAITATVIAADAITAAKIADGAIDAATFAAGAITASAIAADAIGASELAADAVTEIQSGLATAAALNTVDDFLDTEIAAIKAKTDQLTFGTANQVDATVVTNNDKTGYRLSSTGVDDVLRTALTESYAADGAAGTLSQILFGLQAFLQERSVSGTTLTVKKLDGSTTAMTFTLSDATTPVSITRS